MNNNNSLTQNIKSISLLFVFFFITMLQITPAFATDDFDDPAPTDAPIDGGVSLLVAAGIAYGVKKAVVSRKKN